MTRGPIIAIDGPAGAGKSTVARHLALHFGLLNLETGAMYRAFALKAIMSDQDFDDACALERLSRDTDITLEADRSGSRVFLDGADVTERIRDSDVTQGASRVSVHPHCQPPNHTAARRRELKRQHPRPDHRRTTGPASR